MAKQLTIDDCWNAARIEMRCEWRRGQDDPMTGKTWEQIFAEWSWAVDVLRTLDDAPESIDGWEGENSADLCETVLDQIESE